MFDALRVNPRNCRYQCIGKQRHSAIKDQQIPYGTLSFHFFRIYLKL